MIRSFALALACAGTAWAVQQPSMKNTGGDLVFTVADDKGVGYTHQGETHYFNPNELPDGVNYLSFGYQKGMEVGASDAKLTKQLEALNAEKKTIMDEIVSVQKRVNDLQTEYDTQAKKLEGRKRAPKDSSTDPAQTGSSKNCNDGKCSTSGGQHVAVTVADEIFANAEYIWKCFFTWNSKANMMKTTMGVGKVASATGALSAVQCETPAYEPNFLQSLGDLTKTGGAFPVSVEVAQLGKKLKKVGKGENVVHFHTVGPSIQLGSSAPVLLTMAGFGGITYKFWVKDTDTPSGHKVTVTVPTNTFLASAAVKKTGEYYTVSFKAKSSLPTKNANIELTVSATDVNGHSASAKFQVNFMAYRQACWNTYIYDFGQGCNTPSRSNLLSRNPGKKLVDSRISYNDNTFAQHGGEYRDHFATYHTTFLNVEQSGSYRFWTASDDGSQLFIDGRMIINNDGCHGRVERNGGVTLNKGKMYKLEVTFFEHGGGANLDVYWSGPGFGRRSVSGSQLLCMP